jgi:hypothetical protein
MSEFKLPDPKKNSGRILGIGLLAAAGLAVWNYLVPFLVAMAWNTVSLIAAIAIGAVMLMILTSKTFWRRMDIILQALGNLLFGWFVEMNPFNILEVQLQNSEKDRNELLEQKKKLEGQEVSLKQQLDEQDRIMQTAAKKMELCKDRLRANPTDEDMGFQLEAASNEYVNSKDFIEKVAPIRNDIARLVKFADKAYKKSGYALQNARSTLQTQRAAYKAVTAGQNAMTRALKAFSGDPEMNNAADIALRKLKEDIADKIGTIKTCIAETSAIMNTRDLNDAAKVALAADNVEQLNIDQKFDYSATLLDAGHIQNPVGNKWLQTLNK